MSSSWSIPMGFVGTSANNAIKNAPDVWSYIKNILPTVNQAPAIQPQSISPQIQETIGTIANASPGGMQQKLYDFYMANIKKSRLEDEARLNQAAQAAGMGNSSAAVLQNLKLQEQFSEQEQEALDRSSINSQNMYAQNVGADIDKLNTLTQQYYMPSQQSMQAGQFLGGLGTSIAGLENAQQQINNQSMDINARNAMQQQQLSQDAEKFQKQLQFETQRNQQAQQQWNQQFQQQQAQQQYSNQFAQQQQQADQAYKDKALAMEAEKAKRQADLNKYGIDTTASANKIAMDAAYKNISKKV